jgi:hypothetical protein
MKTLFSTANDHAIALARIVLGIIFFMHGAQKTLAWFGGFGFHATMHFFTATMSIPAAFAILAIAGGRVSGWYWTDCGVSVSDRGSGNRGRYARRRVPSAGDNHLHCNHG